MLCSLISVPVYNLSIKLTHRKQRLVQLGIYSSKEMLPEPRV